MIADVPDDALVWKEEIFGPVAVIQSFDSDDEVIAKANATELGLSSYLYTGDLKRGLAMASRIGAAWWDSIAGWCPIPPRRSAG